MPWSEPRTWIAGETVTAAMLNQHVRDQFKALGAPWTPYTPSWTASTTNPTLGGGLLEGFYLRVGNTVWFRARLVFASDTARGSGNYRVGLPATMSIGPGHRFAGVIGDASTGKLWSAFSYGAVTGGNDVALACPQGAADGAAAPIGAAAPFTWATGDYLELAGIYETVSA